MDAAAPKKVSTGMCSRTRVEIIPSASRMRSRVWAFDGESMLVRRSKGASFSSIPAGRLKVPVLWHATSSMPLEASTPMI